MEWLIAITGLPYEVMILILLAVAGSFAGFVDSIVGGGGLISVPAMLLTNLPPSVALGSNKLSSIFGAGSASITFLRNHMVDFRLVRKLLPFTFIGLCWVLWRLYHYRRYMLNRLSSYYSWPLHYL